MVRERREQQRTVGGRRIASLSCRCVARLSGRVNGGSGGGIIGAIAFRGLARTASFTLCIGALAGLLLLGFSTTFSRRWDLAEIGYLFGGGGGGRGVGGGLGVGGVDGLGLDRRLGLGVGVGGGGELAFGVGIVALVGARLADGTHGHGALLDGTRARAKVDAAHVEVRHLRGPLLLGVLLSESLGVVALGLEELLEVRLAVVLPVEGGVVTEGQPTGAVLALHTGLVEDLTVGVHPLHRIHRLCAGVTFYRESERHLLFLSYSYSYFFFFLLD